MLLLAAGVGATPLMALLRQWAALSAVLRKERPQLALDPFSDELPFPSAVLLIWTVPTVAACSWGLGAVRSVVLDPILQHRIKVVVHVTREKDVPASITFHRALDADLEAVTPSTGPEQEGAGSSPRARSRRVGGTDAAAGVVGADRKESGGRQARMDRASTMLLAAHGAMATAEPPADPSAGATASVLPGGRGDIAFSRLSVSRHASMRELGPPSTSKMNDELAAMIGGVKGGIAPARDRISSVAEFGRRGVVDLRQGRPDVPATFEVLEEQLRHIQAMRES